MSIEPAWGEKKNSEGKNDFCRDAKAHFAVWAISHYLFQNFICSITL